MSEPPVEAIQDLRLSDHWVVAQRQAYLAWVNSYLEVRSLKLSSLAELCDGVLLIQFLEVLTDTEFKPRYEKKPTLRLHKVANIQVILRYLFAFYDVRLVNLSPENIVDEDEKMLLGLLYCIYEKFQIRPLEAQGRKAEDSLLAWVRQVVADRCDPPITVSSYSLGFMDGKAFLALVDAFVDDKAAFDYNQAVRPDDHLHNVQLAFQAAEDYMRIPQLLDPKLVVSGKVQDRTMVLAVSMFYNVFKTTEAQREQQAKLREIETELMKKSKMVEHAEHELQKRSLELQNKAQEIEKAARDLEKMTKEVKAQQSKQSPIETWIEYNRDPQGLLPVITIPFSSLENGKKRFTLYHIKVVLGTKIWVVQRRYSQFSRLHSELQKLYGKKAVTPKLPPKKTVGNLKPTFVATRGKQLEGYLGELSQDELFLKSTLLTNFLTKNPLSNFIDVEAFMKQEIENADKEESFLSDDDDDWVSDGFY